MDYAGYVLTGYAVVFSAIGTYAFWLVKRGKDASRDVPPERRRWSDST
jgi:CcmD family protein